MTLLGGSPSPHTYSMRKLLSSTRAYLSRCEHQDSLLCEPRNALEAIPHAYLTHELTPGFAPLDLPQRMQLLRVLSDTNTRYSERRTRALLLLKSQHDHFSGWSRLVHQADYQLGEAIALWGPGDFSYNESFIKAMSPAERATSKFERISQEEYRNRVRADVIHLLLNTHIAHFATLADIIALYTSEKSARESANDLIASASDILVEIKQAIRSELRQKNVRIPMRPLYSLPREARDLENLFLSVRAEDILIKDQQAYSSRELPPKSGARLVPTAKPSHPHQQSLLFFNEKLVRRTHAGQDAPVDTFIELKLEQSQYHEQPLSALIHAIEELGVDARIMEHLPRICAGIFTLAQQDKKMGVSWAGTFWDTESGSRLCKAVGFDPQNRRHRARIQDIREMFEKITLHRQVRGVNEKGRKTQMMWQGPLIEPRAANIEIEEEWREGFTRHYTLNSWSIAKPLWDMVTPREEGGTPAFMLVDQRAFLLDETSSLPFNLYWTLINRAYMSAYTQIKEDQLDRNGVFSPRLGSLCKWSGLEGKFQRPSRLKRVLVEIFDNFKKQGLVTHWVCEPLHRRKALSFEELYELRVEVGLSKSQLLALTNEVEALREDAL